MNLEWIFDKKRTTPDRLEKSKHLSISELIKTKDDVYYGFVEGKSSTHSPSIDINNQTCICTCEDSLFNNVVCKHLLCLIRKIIGEEEFKKYTEVI